MLGLWKFKFCIQSKMQPMRYIKRGLEEKKSNNNDSEQKHNNTKDNSNNNNSNNNTNNNNNINNPKNYYPNMNMMQYKGLPYISESYI